MKKYYVMEVKDESAGEFPNNYNSKGVKSASALRQYIRKNNEFPEYIPNLKLKIYDDPEFNKINDFIFGPVNKFCVSKRVKEALQEFNLPEHSFIPLTYIY